MTLLKEKLEKVEYINNKNLDLVHKGFTGKRTVHWKNGEPMEEEENKKNKIRLE